MGEYGDYKEPAGHLYHFFVARLLSVTSGCEELDGFGIA